VANNVINNKVVQAGRHEWGPFPIPVDAVALEIRVQRKSAWPVQPDKPDGNPGVVERDGFLISYDGENGTFLGANSAGSPGGPEIDPDTGVGMIHTLFINLKEPTNPDRWAKLYIHPVEKIRLSMEYEVFF
jgi:hypothetical protein